MRGNGRVRFALGWNAVARRGAGLALAAVLVSGWLSPAMAQSGPKTKARQTALSREERDQYINDLSNSREFGGFEDKATRNRRPAEKLDVATPEMKKLRPLIDEFSKEISLLNSQLSDELSETPSVRTLLGDMYKLTADSVLLAKHAKVENDHHLLFDEMQQIDASWGELSYRLGTVRKLSRDSQDSIANLNDIAGEIRQSLDIGQQVNYRDLSNKTVSLATDLENLMEDIQVQLRRTQDGQKLYSSTSKAHQQVLAMADLSDDKSDLKSITKEYERFRELWYPQAAALQSKDGEFQQSLRRIARTDGEIARLLLIQQKFDKTQIVYLTSALRKQIDEFFQAVPLKQLIQLPKASQALSTADEFYGVCEHFTDTVNGQDDYNHIVDAFREIEQADRNFVKVFGDIDNQDAASSLEKISQTLTALRSAIQVDHDDFSRQTANALAAKIENLTDNIDITSRSWLAHDRQSFSQDCLDETDALAQAAQKLHDEIVNGANVAQIRKDTEDLYQSWRRVYSYLVKCQTDDRPMLGRFSSQLTPALVELRTLVAQ
jgi:hypothetical protein